LITVRDEDARFELALRAEKAGWAVEELDLRIRKEKWGRYLGDVFYSKNGSSAPIYLNQALLDKGYAVRVRM